MIVAEERSNARSRSVPATRREAIETLRAAGAERISDHFIVPATDGHPSGSTPSASRQEVGWRERSSEHWVRTADVPFDLLPLSPKATERRNTVFSLGPGLDARGFEHPAVLLMQIEGTKRETAAELHRLMPLLSTLVVELRTATCLDRDDGGLRICVAGIVPCT